MVASAGLRGLGHGERAEEASPGVGGLRVDGEGRAPCGHDDERRHGEQLLAESIERVRTCVICLP